MAADYTKIHRLLRLLVLMQQGDAGNAGALAERLGVKERTIYRDLSTLTDLGIPCFFDEDAGGYRVRRDFFLPPVHLTTGETLALMTLTNGIGGHEQIAMTEPAVKAIEKIRAQLPPSVVREIGDVDGLMNVNLPASGPAGESIKDVFSRVQWSLRHRRALRCRYDSLNAETDTTSFLLHPYSLSFDQRAWYVVGYHAGREEIRRLKLNRFLAVTPTDEPYTIPNDFSIDEFRGYAWRMIRGEKRYHVVIQFDATVAETVSDTNWHSTQDVEDHADGSITFRCEVDGLDEIVWWVLGYGPHAIVQEPEELAEMVERLARQTAENYRHDD